MRFPQLMGLSILLTVVFIGWLVIAATRQSTRVMLAMLFGLPIIIGAGLLLFGCAEPEPLEPWAFPVEDAGESCRGACYAACPEPQNDTEARDCVWECNRGCYDAGR